MGMICWLGDTGVSLLGLTNFLIWVICGGECKFGVNELLEMVYLQTMPSPPFIFPRY